MTKKAILEIARIDQEKDEVVFNIVYLDTGEIRQKRRSMEWLMKRIFFHELRTYKKKYGEIIEYDKEDKVSDNTTDVRRKPDRIDYGTGG